MKEKGDEAYVSHWVERSVNPANCFFYLETRDHSCHPTKKWGKSRLSASFFQSESAVKKSIMHSKLPEEGLSHFSWDPVLEEAGVLCFFGALSPRDTITFAKGSRSTGCWALVVKDDNRTCAADIVSEWGGCLLLPDAVGEGGLSMSDSDALRIKTRKWGTLGTGIDSLLKLSMLRLCSVRLKMDFHIIWWWSSESIKPSVQ